MVHGHRAELLAAGMRFEGRELKTPQGSIHRGDLVAFQGTRQSIEVGFALNLLQHHDGAFHCFLEVLEPLDATCFNPANKENRLIPAAAVHGVFPYILLGPSIYLVASADCLR